MQVLKYLISKGFVQEVRLDVNKHYPGIVSFNSKLILLHVMQSYSSGPTQDKQFKLQT